jgi:hypothetical protein
LGAEIHPERVATASVNNIELPSPDIYR